MKRAYAILWALDAIACAVVYGVPGSLLSAEFARRHGVSHWFCRAVDWFAWHVFGEAQHCETALRNYDLRNAAAPFA